LTEPKAPCPKGVSRCVKMPVVSMARNRVRAKLVLTAMKPRGPILSQPVILLVEDEPLVRLTQMDVLREAGFWVLEAEDADEAFDILRRRGDVSVILTDVDMPGSLDGFEFSRLAAQGWPDVGVLVISGKAFPDEGDLPPSAVFIAKPVQPDALVDQLKTVMRS
jgi:two-component system, response regulator PdtaR